MKTKERYFQFMVFPTFTQLLYACSKQCGHVRLEIKTAFDRFKLESTNNNPCHCYFDIY